MRYDAKTSALETMQKEAEELEHGATFMRTNGVEGWEEVQQNADRMAKAATDMAESSSVDFINWEAGKSAIDALVAKAAAAGGDSQSDEDNFHHSREERAANELSKFKANLTSQFLVRQLSFLAFGLCMHSFCRQRIGNE